MSLDEDILKGGEITKKIWGTFHGGEYDGFWWTVENRWDDAYRKYEVICNSIFTIINVWENT